LGNGQQVSRKHLSLPSIESLADVFIKLSLFFAATHISFAVSREFQSGSSTAFPGGSPLTLAAAELR